MNENSAIVPSKFIQSSLYHYKSDHDLFSYQTGSKIENIELSCENEITGNEIEILIAVFHKAGFDKSRDKGKGFGSTAKFKSINELLSLAFNKKSLTGSHYEALKSIQQPRPIVFKEKIGGRSLRVISDDAPIKIETTDNGIICTIHTPWLRYSNSYKILPLGISSLYHSVGIKRVETPLTKFLLWSVFHLTEKPRSWDTLKIMNAIGLNPYFKNRNNSRARKIFYQGINALHELGFVSKPQSLSIDKILLGAGEKIKVLLSDEKVLLNDEKVLLSDELAKYDVLEFSTKTMVPRRFKNERKFS